MRLTIDVPEPQEAMSHAWPVPSAKKKEKDREVGGAPGPFMRAVSRLRALVEWA